MEVAMRLQLDPGQGTPPHPIHQPEESKRESPIEAFKSGSTGVMDPMSGPSHEARKHMRKHGSKSSSRPKKDTASSTSSSHGDMACSKAHKYDKKSHRIPVPVIKRCTPSRSAPLKSSKLSVLRQSSIPAPVPVLFPTAECMLLALGRLKSAPSLNELFVLEEVRSPRLQVHQPPKRIHSPALDLPPSGHIPDPLL